MTAPLFSPQQFFIISSSRIFTGTLSMDSLSYFKLRPFFNTLPSPTDLLLGLCSYKGCTTAGKPAASSPHTPSFPACLHPITAHFWAPGITSALTHLFYFSTCPTSLLVSVLNSLSHNWVILSRPCSKCQQSSMHCQVRPLQLNVTAAETFQTAGARMYCQGGYAVFFFNCMWVCYGNSKSTEKEKPAYECETCMNDICCFFLNLGASWCILLLEAFISHHMYKATCKHRLPLKAPACLFWFIYTFLYFSTSPPTCLKGAHALVNPLMQLQQSW